MNDVTLKSGIALFNEEFRAAKKLDKFTIGLAYTLPITVVFIAMNLGLIILTMNQGSMQL